MIIFSFFSILTLCVIEVRSDVLYRYFYEQSCSTVKNVLVTSDNTCYYYNGNSYINTIMNSTHGTDRMCPGVLDCSCKTSAFQIEFDVCSKSDLSMVSLTPPTFDVGVYEQPYSDAKCGTKVDAFCIMHPEDECFVQSGPGPVGNIFYTRKCNDNDPPQVLETTYGGIGCTDKPTQAEHVWNFTCINRNSGGIGTAEYYSFYCDQGGDGDDTGDDSQSGDDTAVVSGSGSRCWNVIMLLVLFAVMFV